MARIIGCASHDPTRVALCKWDTVGCKIIFAVDLKRSRQWVPFSLGATFALDIKELQSGSFGKPAVLCTVGQLPKCISNRRTRVPQCRGTTDACEIDLVPEVKCPPVNEGNRILIADAWRRPETAVCSALGYTLEAITQLWLNGAHVSNRNRCLVASKNGVKGRFRITDPDTNN